MYSARRSRFPLTPEVQKITGLNDQVLKGQKIDWEKVRGFFSRASVAIAHNMQFDRGFCYRGDRGSRDSLGLLDETYLLGGSWL